LRLRSTAWRRLRSSYDQVASRYDDAFAHELDDKPRDCELLRAFATAVDDPVVEVGSGPGQIGAFVAGLGRRVIALDLSIEMARLARDRLGSSVQADMRAVPFAPGRVGGLLAFYSLIHLRRDEVGPAVAQLAAVLRPGGRILLSAHEGRGEIRARRFLGRRVPFVATLFELDELVLAVEGAGLEVRHAERREPHESEHPTGRLYVDAARRR
jgi:SAM-dependent methyltransferase